MTIEQIFSLIYFVLSLFAMIVLFVRGDYWKAEAEKFKRMYQNEYELRLKLREKLNKIRDITKEDQL